ncbi:aluminum-activated malate transporter 10-like [Salvia hispanica]|uniref:aluminum-activated malate transporter 10-like n=1 Tax=Salvia hispanica TaxID=49212 RepID=UPI002009412F|nr:aluminum-activated malate transporter 10-like [Salvia hispanica]
MEGNTNTNTNKEIGVEWRINMGDGTSRVLEAESRFGLQRFVSKVGGFFQRAWRLGVNEPKKSIHCVKVGLALCLVSLFYYMRPLYDGVGGNAMWAVMTVVVVFEYTVGATLCKCVNRATGTFLAGALGVGVHWVASQSGERFEPIILQVSVFLLATAATFSRFIPSIKARFDYGAMIFILTFSLISVSGYRVEKLFEMAHHRLSTIAIGTSICIITTILFCPVWAGTELHNLIRNNMDKLSDSLDGPILPAEAKAGEAVTLVEVVPLVTVSSLLIEIAARTEKLAGAVNGVAEKAEFEVETAEEAKRGQSSKGGN